ncbi:MAG: aromatic ring-hydroxylating dioxygenase subunit alpha [Candidatus Obscuribacterales bacterium]|nr:aromatic ring-hydroxylating dioxygenase subunit alpha [Candidatus Obscuribacterales bacterium]
MTLDLIPTELRGFARQWLAVATTSELRNRPLTRTVIGLPIVLFRHSGGVAAMLDRCPHRNVPLSAGSVNNDALQCSYHGWEFNPTGQCVNIPGRSDCPQQFSVPSFSVIEKDDLIFVRLENTEEDDVSTSTANILPTQALSPFKSGLDSFLWINELECNFINGLENLLDPMHPAFVHSLLVRTSAKRSAMDINVIRTEEKLEVIYNENQIASGFIPRLFEGLRTQSIGRYYPPFSAQLEYRSPKGTSFILTTVFSPVDQNHTRTFSWLSTPCGLIPAFLKEAVTRLIFAPVLKQDQQILSLQSSNISRFGEEQFVSTKLDIVRPHILHFLNNHQTKKVLPLERSLCIEI